MEITGTIKIIGNTETFGANNFRKRELVLTTDEQYPQDILIEFVQAKCDLLNTCKIGQSITVGINLRGREWVNPQGETKYFNSIQGWKIDVSNNTQSNLPHVPPADAFEPAGYSNNEDDDDLPF